MHRLVSLRQQVFGSALISLLLLAVMPAPALADAKLNELRTAYLEADRLLDQRKTSQWLGRKAKLKPYPLYHYLIIKEVRNTHSEYTNSQISKIVSRVDVPLPGNFSHWWLKRLRDRKDWNLIIKHYANASDTETRCTYALAVMRSKSREEAMQELKPLWLVGRSQAEQCDPLFEQALKKGYIDDDLIWQRILLTQRRNQVGMTKYLASLLRSQNVKTWADRLQRVHRNPRATVHKHLSKWSQSPYGRDVITHGMVRITRKDSDSGIAFWRELKSNSPDSIKRLAETELRIAQILGWRRHQQAYQWLARLPDSLLDSSLLQLKVRNALAGGNWSQVLKAIDNLGPDDANRSEWQYWRAMALDKAGHRQDAKPILASLASQRNFYGMLAADHLNLKYSLTPDSQHFNSTELSTLVDSEPALARIREWLAISKPYSARRELNHLKNTRKDEAELWIQVANLFHNWGWHDGAIRAAYISGQADDLPPELTHPSPYINYVRREAIRNSVPQHWIYGIMRQESLFVHDIRSGAGAIGLMQLLPSTARNVAKRNGLKRPSNRDLSNASLNIRLGTTYFRRLLNRLDENPVHSLAGYNAGPRRVDQWKKSIRVAEPAAWVESIPFTETRNYVKKILVNFIIYENIHDLEHSRIEDYLQPSATQHAVSSSHD